MERDVEELEAGVEDLQGEVRIGERAEVRRHPEVAVAVGLRELDVLEELAVHGRLAVHEEQHVVLAAALEDGLPGLVDLRGDVGSAMNFSTQKTQALLQ